MVRLSFQKFIAALVVGAMLLSSFASLTKAADANAPLAQAVRAKQVKGTIKGGQFAKIWLGLETETPNAQITVTSDWDRDNPTQHGVGFFILDSNGLTRAQAGDALNTIALAAGNPSFVVTAPSNQLGASINATGTAKYTIVVYNDSSSDANFTLTATNAFIVDDSNQVTNPNAAATTAPQNGTAVAGSTTVTNTTTTTKTATAAPATPAATTATTTTTAASTATAAPVPVGTPGVIKAAQLSGDLPNQNDQHFLGLQPGQRDATITLRLTFDPQDSSELARRLNFWVLDQSGFSQFQSGSNASDVAIAAGSRDVDSQINERVAHFKAVGLGNYTVIVYNNSRVPGSYTLSVDGGLLVDDSGQTRNAKQAAAAVSATTTTTSTKTSTTATATPAAQASTTSTTTTTSATRTGTPGGTYTVKAGDTLALIARDIYGNYKLYQQLCDFNNIASCDAIEVGQVVKLPTQAQITAGITRSGAAATPTTAKPTPTPTTATSTTTSGASTTATNAVTSTTAAATPTSTVASSQSVTETTSVTTTGSTTSTADGGGGANIVDTAIANGGLKTLVAALQATGADSTLRGAGPFTLFAPTDAAFAALPRGSLQQLMANPTGQLTDIVRYHIVKGKLMAEDLSDGLQATTLQGKPVRFSVSGNTIKINGYRVLTKDIQASNGVIHIIETVILPPAD